MSSEMDDYVPCGKYVKLPSLTGWDNHDLTKRRSPGYKLGIRTQSLKKQDDGDGPGPGAYYTRTLTSRGKAKDPGTPETGGYKIGSRPKQNKIEDDNGPGPGAYMIRDLTKTGYKDHNKPGYKISGRNRNYPWLNASIDITKTYI